jgi:hypothetical protein
MGACTHSSRQQSASANCCFATTVRCPAGRPHFCTCCCNRMVFDTQCVDRTCCYWCSG